MRVASGGYSKEKHRKWEKGNEGYAIPGLVAAFLLNVVVTSQPPPVSLVVRH